MADIFYFNSRINYIIELGSLICIVLNFKSKISKEINNNGTIIDYLEYNSMLLPSGRD